MQIRGNKSDDARFGNHTQKHLENQKPCNKTPISQSHGAGGMGEGLRYYDVKRTETIGKIGNGSIGNYEVSQSVWNILNLGNSMCWEELRLSCRAFKNILGFLR